MKKLICAIIVTTFSWATTASAEFGVNVGVSGNLGLFAASAKETENSKINNGTDVGVAAYPSIFIEGKIGDMLTIGVDILPEGLETDEVETAKKDKTTSDSQSDVTNKVKVGFEDMMHAYVAINVYEGAYIKAGAGTVDVLTKESLGTGSQYPDTSLDFSMMGVGYHADFDTHFVRIEGTYMDFDGVTLTSSTNSDNTITLKSLDGVTGKISVGMSF